MSSCISRTSCSVSTGLTPVSFIAACYCLLFESLVSGSSAPRRAGLQLFPGRQLLGGGYLHAELR